MKKLLPTSHTPNVISKKGFTLIELLVVVSILAVLAVIGFAAFSGLIGRGNNARRAADVKAIADALEVKKGSNTTYQQILGTDFTGGVFPEEPARKTASTPKYCYTDGTVVILNPGVWTNTDCPAFGSGNGTGWMVINNTTPPNVSGTATFFKVCAMDEAKTAVVCAGSRQ